MGLSEYPTEGGSEMAALFPHAHLWGLDCKKTRNQELSAIIIWANIYIPIFHKYTQKPPLLSSVLGFRAYGRPHFPHFPRRPPRFRPLPRLRRSVVGGRSVVRLVGWVGEFFFLTLPPLRASPTIITTASSNGLSSDEEAG